MIEQLHLDICDVKTAITGGLGGQPGINERIKIVEIGVAGVETEVLEIQEWREDHNRRLSNFLWKVVASTVVGGGLFGAAFKLLPLMVK